MTVELLSHFGDDLMIADVARVSFDKQASNYTPEQNERLINYLWKHKHTSPFRHPQLQFRIKCPIYVERQIFKHQQGISINSISGRYVDFSDTYYSIQQFRVQSTDSKQGSGSDLSPELNARALSIQQDIIERCKAAYDKLIAMNVSKEQARSILPLNLETTFIWTGSFQAFAHLCDLRLKPDTQKETRDLVAMMMEEVEKLGCFEWSLNAIRKY